MIDGIIALGHFCETHGPCVILCTQRYEEEPKQAPHNLTVPWCETCQSIDLTQLLICRDTTGLYVTSRTPLKQDLAFLLKQAVVRSLSCEEETSKNGSTMYFGDNERGHVFSHTFSLQDSLARGFYRKYCIVVLMKDKVFLLNAWFDLNKFVKEVVDDLQTHAKIVNGSEQEKQSQRAFRQAQSSSAASSRSLSQLTGQPAVFAHVHLWFCWILNLKVASEKLKFSLEPVPSPKPYSLLRALYQEMGQDIFSCALYCCLTGVQLSCDLAVVNCLKILLPNSNWSVIFTNSKCEIYKFNNEWIIVWSEVLPKKLPSLQTQCLNALKDTKLPDNVLETHMQLLIQQWQNIIYSLCKCPSYSKPMLQSLGVQLCDLPLLKYWIFHLGPAQKYQIIDNLRKELTK